LLIDDRQTNAILKLVHQYQIAALQRGQHRPGRYTERLYDKRPKREYKKNDRKKTDTVFYPPWRPIRLIVGVLTNSGSLGGRHADDRRPGCRHGGDALRTAPGP